MAVAARIVAVLAHPDDEMTMSGTLARAVAGGADVTLVCATNGAGGAGNATLTRGELARTRRAELLAACAEIGVARVEILEDEEPDHHLDKGNYAGVVAEHVLRVRRILDDMAADAVLTFGPDGVSGHPTHVLVGQVARRAARASASRPVVHQVCYTDAHVRDANDWLAAHPSVWSVYLAELAKTPNIGSTKLDLYPVPDAVVGVRVDVSAYRAVRVAAAAHHVSQGGASYDLVYLASDVECFTVLDAAGEPVLGLAVTDLMAGAPRTVPRIAQAT